MLLGQAWNPGSEAGQRPALLLLEPEDFLHFNFPDSQAETGYKNQNMCNCAEMDVLGHGEGSGTQHPPVNAGGPKMTGAMKLAQLGYLILFVNSVAKKKSLSKYPIKVFIK